MADPHVLVVTSAGAAASAVVPVLAAIEAAGMRVRAIDVGQEVHMRINTQCQTYSP